MSGSRGGTDGKSRGAGDIDGAGELRILDRLGLRRRRTRAPARVPTTHDIPMKSIRVLAALSVFALCASLASADCGSCEKKEHCDKEKAKCEEKCEKACDKKECTEADKAKCDKEKMECCEKAAKEGKACEKCNPPEKK